MDAGNNNNNTSAQFVKGVIQAEVVIEATSIIYTRMVTENQRHEAGPLSVAIKAKFDPNVTPICCDPNNYCQSRRIAYSSLSSKTYQNIPQ